MENIRIALERARAFSVDGGEQSAPSATSSPSLALEPHLASIENLIDGQGREVTLNLARLESNRIIAHDDADPRSKCFDMLRTQVLQSMDRKNWKVLGVTSPSPGCGKTVAAVNLALSIARQPDRSVLLVDLDLRKPQVASYLGINCDSGAVSVLNGRTSLSSAVVKARAGDYCITVLPAESTTSDSAALMVSRAMSAMLQEIKRNPHSYTVIIDLPPMLWSDDVIAVLPQLDCVLLLAAVGKSTVAEVEECTKHLQSAEVIRFVLNKSPELTKRYNAYY